MSPAELVEWMRDLGVAPGEHLALGLLPGRGFGLAIRDVRVPFFDAAPFESIAAIDSALGPRWVWWDHTTARSIAQMGLPIDRCWDILAVQRLLCGGWRWNVQSTWAELHGLSEDTIPQLGQLDLLARSDDTSSSVDAPLQADGHLRPEWTDAAWSSTPENMAEWASLALQAAGLQADRLRRSDDPARALSTAHAESVAALLCGELEARGLPIDEDVALRILADTIGPRPTTTREEDELRSVRDERVLELLDPRQDVNLRNSGEVKAMLRRLDIDVADTRAWRLERMRDSHPVIDALLTWRKAERIATTYGYRWFDAHVRDGRLRGEWSSADGSAGRMTASSGLHNLPADMRSAVAAAPGHHFVRADLGQIEPRVLAAVSGDDAFIDATRHDDLYAEVAGQLGVERDVAKLAVLGAMYGSTTGESAHALRRLERTYPVAMAFLERAARSGRERRDVRTLGGRRIRLSGASNGDDVGDLDAAQTAAGARGRYARNAVIQGAAAEFFKVWAIIVRRRVRPFAGEVVLCLHDELLVHVPSSDAVEVAEIVSRSVGEAAHYWSPSPAARFVADVSVIERWSDAKP